MTERNKNIFYILLFFAMFGWGASWINAKVLSNYINEYEMVFFRFSITAITMIPIILVLKKSFKIDFKSALIAILTSIVFIAYMKYYFLGTKFGTASLGGAFVTTLIPINTFLFLAILRIKKIQSKDYFALFLGAIGVLTMLHIWNFDLNSILQIQNLYFILAAILWPIITILSSKATNISPIVFTFYLYIFMSTIDFVFFIDLDNIKVSSFDNIFWINLFSISIFASTLANTIYFLGIEKLGPTSVNSFIFLVPFFAITLGAVFLKEDITLSMIVGTALTLIAIKILNNIKLPFLKKKY